MQTEIHVQYYVFSHQQGIHSMYIWHLLGLYNWASVSESTYSRTTGTNFLYTVCVRYRIFLNASKQCTILGTRDRGRGVR